MLNALRELKRLEFAHELDELEKNLNEAITLRDEMKLRAAINSVDVFAAAQGQKFREKILDLLPKEKEE